MRIAGRAGLFAAVAWLGVLVLAAGAQEPPKKENAAEQAARDEEFWFSSAKRRAATAAQLVAAQNPITIAAMRLRSVEELVFGELEFANEFAPPLNADSLANIVDGRVMPVTAGKARDEIKKSDWAMYDLYNEALLNAFQQPAEVFKKSARENDFIKFAHIWREPRNHRGKVIPLQGRLARLRKYEATTPAKLQGIRFVYEGWVFGETKHAHPYAVIFPTLPDGLEISEKLNRPVTFNGYFIGKIRVAVPKGDIDVPLLIGPTIHVAPEPPAELDETPFSLVVLIGVVASLAGLVAVICGISWWFKKGDTAIEAKLAARREQETLAAMESPEHWSQPPETNPPETDIRPSPPAGGV